MKPSRLHGVLRSLLKQRWPAFIWGPPGIGKSSIVHSIGREHGVPVVDLRASLLDPTDLRGIPAIESGRAVWCPPAFLPSANDEPGILFLDEIKYDRLPCYLFLVHEHVKNLIVHFDSCNVNSILFSISVYKSLRII